MPDRPAIPGARLTPNGAEFAIDAPDAEAAEVCIFSLDGSLVATHPMKSDGRGNFTASLKGIEAEARYGFRVDGPWQPERGHRFDRSKLLVDPYATRIDRPFVYDSRLGEHGVDTQDLVPRAILESPQPDYVGKRPAFEPGGIIYEVPVRAFTMLHPDIPEAERGTLLALTHPAVIAHFKSLHISAVELMPIAAWIDERHLPPLGLTNAWGYNPVTMLALDPRLAPGGVSDLRKLAEALHAHGINLIVDVVYNHTGESDIDGPSLSLRGLGNATYYAHDPHHPDRLINDTGCGNTLACFRPQVRELVLAAMRHLVLKGGVDGFRFDLAPILGRTPEGFSAHAEMLTAISNDPALRDRILIAEPWDIGPGGYQLGSFPPSWLEWNDRARDDMRLFWRGDPGKAGDLATRLAGSSDIFARDDAKATRSVNFIAAHDGFPLGDLVAYAEKHNEANGENNRDGHGENHSWNNGVEGPTDDPSILAAREADARALIATLLASRGTVLLTAGDEFGHTQGGNNNAYAQDNEITWRDWSKVNSGRLEFTRAWARLRHEIRLLREQSFLIPGDGSDDPQQVEWLALDGSPLKDDGWHAKGNSGLLMILGALGERLAIGFNRSHQTMSLNLPESRHGWRPVGPVVASIEQIPPRSVITVMENAD